MTLQYAVHLSRLLPCLQHLGQNTRAAAACTNRAAPVGGDAIDGRRPLHALLSHKLPQPALACGAWATFAAGLQRSETAPARTGLRSGAVEECSGAGGWWAWWAGRHQQSGWGAVQVRTRGLGSRHGLHACMASQATADCRLQRLAAAPFQLHTTPMLAVHAMQHSMQPRTCAVPAPADRRAVHQHA